MTVCAHHRKHLVAAVWLFAFIWLAQFANAQSSWSVVLPEERTITVRDPGQLWHAHIPDTPPPPTVSDPPPEDAVRQLSLDEAIRIALENSEVVRVLTGVSASSSGRTIYDTAMTQTVIDQQKGRFDPTIKADNSFNRSEFPGGPDATETRIDGTRTDDYQLDAGVSKTTLRGGTAALGVRTNPSRFQPGVFPLNPENRSSVDLSFTQPLLQGGGIGPNRAPIVLARIDTERSYFQFKGSIQELVRGVIEAYWSLVSARTDVWARRQQVEQGQEAFAQVDARQRHDLLDVGDVAQTRTALADFRAGLIAAEANLLNREAALRNILGWPPTEPERLVPVTPPGKDRLDFDWDEIVRLAEQHRPDLIELKLVIEADEQLLVQARNESLPSVDAVMLYRWNGLRGETPSGVRLSSGSDQFTDWTLGVNFSVPLGLRQGRAALRQQELVIARDRANLQQGLHSTLHVLAMTVRNLAQSYAQYEAYKETRAAARSNLELQTAEFRSGRTIFLNFLQAITAWGNAVSSEARALTSYNADLANLERQTGTILETHGVRFVEERFRSIGPLGRVHRGRCYPLSLRPTANEDRYPVTSEPAENSFELDRPVRPTKRRTDPSREEPSAKPDLTSPAPPPPARADTNAPESP